jgi:hypothetical protein
VQQREPITYQCINPACGHALPRVVKFCPYCGTPQQGGVVRPVQPVPVVQAEPAPAILPVPEPEAPTATPVSFTPPPAAAQPAPQPAAPQPARAGPTPAAPPQRPPLHWFWWLAGLAVLWLAWIAARPASSKIDARIDSAISLAQDCKGKEAQSELIALRATRATPAQLQRVQTALNQAAGSCERKRQRDKAWAVASSAVEAALTASSVEQARARLATFTRRWGEDEETATLKKRIDAVKREAPAPTPAPARESSRETLRASAQNLMTEAERDISRGNYKGAIDKMDACVGMVDAGNRDCLALKAKATRLYQGL